MEQFAFSDIMAASANVYEEDMEEEEEEVCENELNTFAICHIFSCVEIEFFCNSNILFLIDGTRRKGGVQ